MKHKPKIIVMWLGIALVLAILVYDAYASTHRDKCQTISEMITRASFRYLMIPVIAGILIGHFFWSQKNVFKGMRL